MSQQRRWKRVIACIGGAGFLLVSAAAAEEWYQGGTLHNATAKEWQAATYRNRLATSADFVAGAKAASNMKELRVRAEGLERCITEGTDDPALEELKVKDVAAACLVILGYD
jgi:hypothetical protein